MALSCGSMFTTWGIFKNVTLQTYVLHLGLEWNGRHMYKIHWLIWNCHGKFGRESDVIVHRELLTTLKCVSWCDISHLFPATCLYIEYSLILWRRQLLLGYPHIETVRKNLLTASVSKWSYAEQQVAHFLIPQICRGAKRRIRFNT